MESFYSSNSLKTLRNHMYVTYEAYWTPAPAPWGPTPLPLPDSPATVEPPDEGPPRHTRMWSLKSSTLHFVPQSKHFSSNYTCTHNMHVHIHGARAGSTHPFRFLLGDLIQTQVPLDRTNKHLSISNTPLQQPKCKCSMSAFLISTSQTKIAAQYNE